MELSTAIDEFASMLILGAEALRRLASRDFAPEETVQQVVAAVDAIRAIANQLSDIAGDLRKHQP